MRKSVRGAIKRMSSVDPFFAVRHPARPSLQRQESAPVPSLTLRLRGQDQEIINKAHYLQCEPFLVGGLTLRGFMSVQRCRVCLDQ